MTIPREEEEDKVNTSIENESIIMITELEHLGNIPITTSSLVSMFSDVKAGNQKVRSLESKGKIIRIKKGLYVINPKVSHVMLSTELIANHLYTPSYVSMSSALRYYGLIPEEVYVTQSMTLKHSRFFDTPFGRFDYRSIKREAFNVGVTYVNKQNYSFLIATPEKALCDLIANSPLVNIRYQKDVEIYIQEDISMEIEDLRNMDVTVFEKYAEVGKKACSILPIIKYLKS